jgi:hypothetical protein
VADKPWISGGTRHRGFQGCVSYLAKGPRHPADPALKRARRQRPSFRDTAFGQARRLVISHLSHFHARQDRRACHPVLPTNGASAKTPMGHHAAGLVMPASQSPRPTLLVIPAQGSSKRRRLFVKPRGDRGLGSRSAETATEHRVGSHPVCTTSRVSRNFTSGHFSPASRTRQGRLEEKYGGFQRKMAIDMRLLSLSFRRAGNTHSTQRIIPKNPSNLR